MRTITINTIRRWRPCYDPSRYLPEGWSGIVPDILRMSNVPVKDRLWVAFIRSGLSRKVKAQCLLRCFQYASNKPWARTSALRELRHIVNATPTKLWTKVHSDQFALAATRLRDKQSGIITDHLLASVAYSIMNPATRLQALMIPSTLAEVIHNHERSANHKMTMKTVMAQLLRIIIKTIEEMA